MDDNQTNKGPERTFREGPVKATVWNNQGQNGDYYSTSVARTFKDKDGKLRESQSFQSSHLPLVKEVIGDAHNYIKARREERELSKDEKRDQFKESRSADQSRGRSRGHER